MFKNIDIDIKKKYLINFLLYFLSTGISKLFPFLSLFFYTKFLSPEEYGKLSLFIVFYSFTHIFIGFMLHNYVSINYYKFSKRKISLIIGNIIFLYFLFLLLSFLFYIVIIYILNINIINNHDNFYFLFIPLISIFYTLYELLLVVLKMEEKAKKILILEVSYSFFRTLLIIIFLIYFKNWLSGVYGLLISTVIFGIIALYILFKMKLINFRFISLKILKDILIISYPLLLYILLTNFLGNFEKIFIKFYYSIKTLGIYNFVFMLTSGIYLLISDTFFKIYSPYLYKVLSNDNKITKFISLRKKELLYKIILFFIFFIISIIFYFLYKTYIDYLNIEYKNGIEYIFLLFFFFYTKSLIQFNNLYYIFFKKTKELFVILLYIIPLYVLLIYLFNFLFKIEGIIISLIINNLIYYYMLNKKISKLNN